MFLAYFERKKKREGGIKRKEEREGGWEGRKGREDIKKILNGSQEREGKLFLPTKNTLLLLADLFSH